LPSSFIDEYAPYMRVRFPTMVITSVVLLPLLGLTGCMLLRKSKFAVQVSTATFALEIVVITALLIRWSMPFLPVSLSMIEIGLMNGAIALQVITLYPILGLIVLHYRRLDS
jgi:hypothetical protein